VVVCRVVGDAPLFRFGFNAADRFTSDCVAKVTELMLWNRILKQ
jgi:hypothetical protein